MLEVAPSQDSSDQQDSDTFLGLGDSYKPKNATGILGGDHTQGIKVFWYFTNLDFPEIRGFPLLSYILGWGRVRSLYEKYIGFPKKLLGSSNNHGNLRGPPKK